MRNPLDRIARIGKNRIHDALKRNPRLEWLFDLVIIGRRFRQAHGKYPNLKNPATFSEKIIYKLLHDRRPLLTRVADKLAAREYVRQKIGAQYLTEIYQIARTSSEIEWNKLPSRFVIKTNHGSGWLIIVPDKSKLNIPEAVAKLNLWMSKNYYRYHREWAYRNISPMVYVEELLLDEGGKIPPDFKFHTFSGNAQYMHIDFDRYIDHRKNFYTRDLERIDVQYHAENYPVDPIFPHNIKEMFDLADRLGQAFDYIRIDFYNINGRIVFGELTNYPNTGYMPFTPVSFDEELGSCWAQPKDYNRLPDVA